MSARGERLGQQVPALVGVRGLAIGAFLIYQVTLFTTTMSRTEERLWPRPRSPSPLILALVGTAALLFRRRRSPAF